MPGGDGKIIADGRCEFVNESDALRAKAAEKADADHVTFYSLSPISGNATRRTTLGPVRVHQPIRFECLSDD